MKISPTEIPDVLLVEPRVFQDSRGEFMEVFNQRSMAEFGSLSFVQDNLSYSKRGVLRGLHYQVEKPQGKLVRCARGKAFDVVVDLRRSSPFFGKHVSLILNERRSMLWIPPGFAHGFLALDDDVCFEYKVTEYYSPQHERTILWNDQDLGIVWPLSDEELTLSEKDKNGVAFRNAEYFR
jgi:dTDP-4-dehydrorhamnose 3,5-epimerase